LKCASSFLINLFWTFLVQILVPLSNKWFVHQNISVLWL